MKKNNYAIKTRDGKMVSPLYQVGQFLYLKKECRRGWDFEHGEVLGWVYYEGHGEKIPGFNYWLEGVHFDIAEDELRPFDVPDK